MFTSRFHKKGHNNFGAPKHKCIVTFIDDLNIPIADKYGDQPALELLRFINENGKQSKFIDFILNSFLNLILKTHFMIARHAFIRAYKM